MSAVVTRLAVTPVKALRLHEVEAIELRERGAVGDRDFYVIDDRNRMVNAKTIGELQAVVAEHDADGGALTMTFPDGSAAHAALAYGEDVPTSFHSRPRTAREVVGPWSRALSAHIGQPLRLVAAPGGTDRGRAGAASIISQASMNRLADAGRVDALDPRRFRMLIEIDGVTAHEEDGWIGRRVRVGAALVELRGHVGRCLITSRDPDTGVVDLPTLDFLRSYRQTVDSTEPLPFGVYGAVVTPGAVRVGDPVAVQGEG